MKKRILVFGGSTLCEEKYEQNTYKCKKNKAFNKIRDKFIIDNFSKKSLTSVESINYLSVFVKSRNYSDCIIDFSESLEIQNNIIEFEKNLIAIISLLKKNNIKTILVNPNDFMNNDDYKNIIAKVINNYNVNNIFVDLKINKDNFIIKNINEFNKNILKMCN